MRPAHMLLAFSIVAVWGTNFVVIKTGLRDFPPFLFALLRFFFSAVPFLFFLKRPPGRWRWLVLYGVMLGAGQFALLFWALRADMSPGLASLVIQVQVFFTIGLSMALFHERISRVALAGMALAAAGLAVIGWHLDATITLKGVVLVLFAAFFWAAANIVVKKASREAGARIDILAFVVWSSLFAAPPLAVMTLGVEGGPQVVHALVSAHWDGWAAVAWQVIGNTLFGYVAWSWLITRYDAAIVAPWALLVPVFGMGASSLILGEPLPPWKLAAAAMVIGGVAVGTIIPVLRTYRRIR